MSSEVIQEKYRQHRLRQLASSSKQTMQKIKAHAAALTGKTGFEDGIISSTYVIRQSLSPLS